MHVMPGYQSVHLITVRTGSASSGATASAVTPDAPPTWPDTPPAADRAWVPGCRARTFRQSVAPLYDETALGGSPDRDGFVISIGIARLMPRSAAWDARGPWCQVAGQTSVQEGDPYGLIQRQRVPLASAGLQLRETG